MKNYFIYFLKSLNFNGACYPVNLLGANKFINHRVSAIQLDNSADIGNIGSATIFNGNKFLLPTPQVYNSNLGPFSIYSKGFSNLAGRQLFYKSNYGSSYHPNGNGSDFTSLAFGYTSNNSSPLISACIVSNLAPADITNIDDFTELPEEPSPLEENLNWLKQQSFYNSYVDSTFTSDSLAAFMELNSTHAIGILYAIDKLIAKAMDTLYNANDSSTYIALLNDANDLNNSISIENESIETAVGVNNTTLLLLQNYEPISDSAATTNLLYFANQCPLLYGNYVYRARMLLQNNDQQIDTEWDDNEICNQSTGMRQSKTTITQRIQKTASILSDSKKLLIYPNPSTTNLIIESNNSIQQVSITNLIGQVVVEKEVNTNRLTISTDALPNGVYTVHCTTGTIIQHSKLLIQH